MVGVLLRLTRHRYAPRYDRHDVLAHLRRLPRASAVPLLSWCEVVLTSTKLLPASKTRQLRADRVNQSIVTLTCHYERLDQASLIELVYNEIESVLVGLC